MEENTAIMEPAPAPKLRRGTRVQYRHGKGLSTGRIIRVSKGIATIATRNGFEARRPVECLSRA